MIDPDFLYRLEYAESLAANSAWFPVSTAPQPLDTTCPSDAITSVRHPLLSIAESVRHLEP